jgi:hypothetical protein
MSIICIDVDFQVNCIEKFFNYHDDAFVYIEYKKIDNYNCSYIFTGSHKVNGNIIYVDLFTISGEKEIVNEKTDLIFELCDL